MTSLALPRHMARRLSTRKAIDLAEYQWLIQPVVVFLFARILLSVATYFAEIAIPGVDGPGLWHIDPANVWLDVWARWDSGFYVGIVEDGYRFIPGEQSSVAFFPLYPLAVSLLAPAIGTLAAGVVVSNLFLLGALILLYRLTELEFDASTASRTVIYQVIFPTAFFFSAVYTESTFLFFAVGSFYFARRRMWAWAGLLGMLCSASRIVGLVVWVAIGLEFLISHGLRAAMLRRPSSLLSVARSVLADRVGMVALALPPLGVLSYMAFLASEFGDPVAFSTVQSAWGRELVGPIELLRRDLIGLMDGDWLAGDIWWHVPLDVGAYLAALLLSLAVWRRLGAPYAVFCVLSILLPSASGTGSIARYVVVLFPIFMLLGSWGRYRWFDRGLTISFAVGLGVLATAFVNWVFVA